MIIEIVMFFLLKK